MRFRQNQWATLVALGATLSMTAMACSGTSNSTTKAATNSSVQGSTATVGNTGSNATSKFAVDSSHCPSAATTPLKAGDPIRIAWTGPLSGPFAAAQSQQPLGINAYFDKINAEQGGIDGHKLVLTAADDAFDVSRATTNVQQFLDRDHIFAALQSVGSNQNLATRHQFETACVPNAFVTTGLPQFGDPQKYPFTTSAYMSYGTEARLWAQWLHDQYPKGASVAFLGLNTDYGKTYAAGLQNALRGTQYKLVKTALYEPTSTLTNEVTSLLAAGPDVIFAATAGAACTNVMRLSRQGGFTGKVVIASTCADSATYFKPAGDAAVNGLTFATTIIPTDPRSTNDPAVQGYYADAKKYGASNINPNHINALLGYNMAALLVDALKNAVKLPGGLTSVNLATAIWNLDTTMPVHIKGATAKLNGNNDGYIIEAAEVLQWDKAQQTLVPTGQIYNFEGKTGLYKG